MVTNSLYTNITISHYKKLLYLYTYKIYILPPALPAPAPTCFKPPPPPFFEPLRPQAPPFFEPPAPPFFEPPAPTFFKPSPLRPRFLLPGPLLFEPPATEQRPPFFAVYILYYLFILNTCTCIHIYAYKQNIHYLCICVYVLSVYV